jgi:general secretion pathway protein G
MASNHRPGSTSVLSVSAAPSRPCGRPWPIVGQFTIRDSQLRRASGGFTLIELLVVIALISILASMAVVQHRNSIQKTQEAVLKTNLFRMRDAIDQYYADKGKYPSSLDALVSEQYLRKIPEDPFTRSADTWQTVPAEPDPGNPSAEPGIYDVKSGAPGQALDGTSFSDW